MKINKLIAAVLFLCLAFSLASAEIAPIPLDAKNGTPPAADGFISETEYQDESMTVTIEAHQVGATTCHVARVKIADPSQLRSASAYGFNRPQTEMTNTIARRVKAVVAINGDYYSYTGKGYMIRQGKLYINKPYGDRDVLLIDEKGDFHIEPKATAETLAKYETMGIINSFNFGPGLVVDGVALKEYGHDFNSGDTYAQRSAIAQMKKGEMEYLLITCEGPMESKGGGMTMVGFAEFIASLGVETAYNLDGGNSASMYFNGKKVNAIGNKDERRISDIIYFASAVVE